MNILDIIVISLLSMIILFFMKGKKNLKYIVVFGLCIGIILYILTNILEYRLNNNLPSFVTSNCNEEEFVEKFNERIYSRLKEACALIFMSGCDYRNNSQFMIQKQLLERPINIIKPAV